MAKLERRCGFTLTELLVVIAIIGVLIGLILPAVQKARDAAYRAQCKNNLRQIGFALHQYHDLNHVFPPGVSYQAGKDPYPHLSWLARLLPYIEQEELWRQTQLAFQKDRDPSHNPPHVGLNTVIGLFTCPSDARTQDPQESRNYRIALTSYLGCEGQDLFKKDGVLFLDSKIGMNTITDGTSNTIMVGERPPGPDFWFGWWYAGYGQMNGPSEPNEGSGDMVLGVAEVAVGQLSSCVNSPSSFQLGDLHDECDVLHFWSLHPGGANFLFCDGAVHFLTYDAAPIMPALATRAGGEAVTVPD